MSVSDEEPYSTIFASLKHPIRRRILRMLSKKPMSFSEMLEVLGVSSSFLTYHLENLGELVAKIDDNKYRLSSFGEAAIATMTKVEDIPTTASKMSEIKATETKPKKVVGRSVAIALGIICILLIASLGGIMAYYTMTIRNKENELGSANNTISQLNTNITNLQNQNTNLQNQIDSLNSNITNLQNQVTNFHIESTENSTIWVYNEIVHTNENVYDAHLGENLTLLGEVRGAYAPSAGYVSVHVSSDNNSTFVVLGVPTAFNGTNSDSTYISFPTYDRINVGFGGTVVFPVSPTSYTEIFFGSSVGEATLTITITYYY